MRRRGVVQRQFFMDDERQATAAAAANCSVLTIRRSAGETVSALKVANDNDLRKLAINASAKAGGGGPAIAPTATSRPFGLSLSRNTGSSGPATTSMITSYAGGAVASPAPERSRTCVAPTVAQQFTACRRRRGDRDRRCTALRGQVNREDADASRSATHQNGFAGAEVRMPQAEVRHDAGAPERHRARRRQPGRQRYDVLDSGDRLLGVPATQTRERPDALPDPGPVRVVADSNHRPRNLRTRYETFAESPCGKGTAADQRVHTADPDRLDRDQHLTFTGLRRRYVDDAQPFGAAERLDHYCLHLSSPLDYFRE